METILFILNRKRKIAGEIIQELVQVAYVTVFEAQFSSLSSDGMVLSKFYSYHMVQLKAERLM